MISNQAPIPNHSPIDLGYGTVYCGSKLITSNIQSSLYKYVSHQNMLQYLSNHGEVQVDVSQANNNWGCFSTARKEVSLNMKLFITKWLGNDTATGRVMCQNK